MSIAPRSIRSDAAGRSRSPPRPAPTGAHHPSRRKGLEANLQYADGFFDEMAFPRTTRGVGDVPGLSFLGLLRQCNRASANRIGVAMDARPLAERW
jgi:hypothetical protein